MITTIGTGAVILSLVVVFFILLGIVARYYKKIPPNTVAVVTGRKHKVDEIVRGYRYIVGGGFFLVPIVEEMQTMKLTVIPVKVTVKGVPDTNGALVNVEGIANIKVVSTDDLLPLAIERFLGKSHEEIMQTCLDTLEGNLRGVIAKMTVEKLLQDREAFQSGVMDEAGVDLGKMGIGVDTFKIQSVTDDRDYIKSLGKKQTAEIVRNATIGEAEAKRDADKASAEARRIGETAQAESQKAISDANRDRDVAIAENEAKVKAQQAQIPIAAKVAEAERTQMLNTATVAAERARVEAEINLQEVTEKRNSAALKATIVTSAEKEKEARIIKADAEQQAAEREGEAGRIRAEKDGQGAQAKMTAEALGRIQAATALQKEREAEAAGEQAKLLATAAGTKAQLLAEAEGILKKAEAFKQLDEAGRLLMILSALPPVIEAAGNALEKVVKPAAEAIGEGLGNIDEVRIIDFGGGTGGSGMSGILSQFSNLPVETLFKLWQKAKAVVPAPVLEAVAKKLGVNPDEVSATLAKKVSAVGEVGEEKPAEGGQA